MPANSSSDDLPEQEAAGPADKLRRAREAADLTVDEVAHQLHLSREVVLALESGDFDMLGAPVFVKGHLRSYARLMELDEREVVGGYQPSEPEPEEFRTLSMQAEVKPAASLSNFVLLVGLGVILLVAAVYLLLGDNEPAPPSDFEEVGAYEPDSTATDSAVIDELPDAGAVEPEENVEIFTGSAPESSIGTEESAPAQDTADASATVAPEPAAETESEPAREAPIQDSAEVQKVAVTFRFLDECWAEVSDARRRYLYGLKKPGHESSFMGVPPFKIFLGNAAAVELEIAGKAYKIPADERGGKTARFTIDEEDLR